MVNNANLLIYIATALTLMQVPLLSREGMLVSETLMHPGLTTQDKLLTTKLAPTDGLEEL